MAPAASRIPRARPSGALGDFGPPSSMALDVKCTWEIIGSKHSKFARIRYDRASEAVIFRESLVIKTCPFWILEAFSRSDQHPHGLFQPWRNDVACHPHRDWSYGRHFMGCSTFSEYTVVADISCAKAGNTHGGGGDSSAIWWHMFDMFIGKMAGNMDQWSWNTGVTRATLFSGKSVGNNEWIEGDHRRNHVDLLQVSPTAPLDATWLSLGFRDYLEYKSSSIAFISLPHSVLGHALWTLLLEGSCWNDRLTIFIADPLPVETLRLLKTRFAPCLVVAWRLLASKDTSTFCLRLCNFRGFSCSSWDFFCFICVRKYHLNGPVSRCPTFKSSNWFEIQLQQGLVNVPIEHHPTLGDINSNRYLRR